MKVKTSVLLQVRQDQCEGHLFHSAQGQGRGTQVVAIWLNVGKDDEHLNCDIRMQYLHVKLATLNLVLEVVSLPLLICVLCVEMFVLFN